jgi:hypothetical protein
MITKNFISALALELLYVPVAWARLKARAVSMSRPVMLVIGYLVLSWGSCTNPQDPSVIAAEQLRCKKLTVG